ncbi:MerR family transcriptional regulator [Mycobacterium ulcerans]|uniref:Transcriptional regulator n=2 Tax=Mycobacterium ulcerans TaxID=1809 RepID=A0PKC0_MYCUA|nr:MerR family transcriptional regulator [Mycobacterium ulcerans]ABL02789.1 transcriptional regulator [Mycobacterium ulcerans Agy99]MEB3904619.1 MerR family transcriptional regulator [Mycobacterium ulcerans]MEB3908839.1 MerR family transcriptional regulator [Mycobacterium ulcerans]MEB3919084.1 MerR family transcriptional regulator [Mycobacterium ulcerans]MEB3923134.1 MerR family transcriptional regulator [Mycobacterium ulcerans]
MDGLTVGQVAERFGITVRTLHHYDEIGLLIPSRRAASGYRVYTSADLTRLSQVIVYRRLELPLDEIARLLDEGNAVSHLVRQRERVMARLDEMKDLVEAIDLALEKAMTNTPMTDDDMRELFGDGFDDYRVETEQKWGETAEWKESQRRTKSYGKDEWVRIKAEGQAIEKALSDAFRAGLPADSEEAMNAAEQHRRHVNRWFYDCPPAFHRNLGDMYVSDPRYIATYDESFGLPGLAAYCREAIHANANRAGG